MRCLLIVGLLACSAHAELATDYNGRQLLLATQWRLGGGPDSPGPVTIYRLHEGQWSPLTQATGNVGAPALSSDGTVAAWERYSPCFGSCMFALPRSRSEADGLQQELKIYRYLVFYSRSGRFAVTPGFSGLVPWEMQDLETGTVWKGASSELTRVAGVSDNGTLLGVHDDQVAIWRPGGEMVHLMPATNMLSMQISANSRAAVVETGSYQGKRTLTYVDLASKERRVIAEWESDPPEVSLIYTGRTISDDGTRILFYAERRLRLLDKGVVRVLADVPEGIWHVTLSGSGRVAYALTRTGRLLKIDTDSSETQDLIGGLPLQVSQQYGGAVPGSALQLYSPGWPPGLQFLAAGHEFPLVDTPEQAFAYVQIPWEFPVTGEGGSYSLAIRREGSPFEFTKLVTISSRPWADFARRNSVGGEPQIKAALPDWSRLVTPETPAIPGTTVHAYVFGLGPVDRPVRTGERGPDDPPARPLTTIACYLRGPENNPAPRGLELPFIAYAPGLIGVYQVDMTIPADWPAGRHFINCEGAGYTSGAIYIGTSMGSPLRTVIARTRAHLK